MVRQRYSWVTDLLGEHYTDAGVEMLRRLGVTDPWPLLASLAIGEAWSSGRDRPMGTRAADRLGVRLGFSSSPPVVRVRLRRSRPGCRPAVPHTA